MSKHRTPLLERSAATARWSGATLVMFVLIHVVSLSRASAQDLTARPMTGELQLEETRPNVPLLIGGLAVIAATYIPPVIVAASSDVDGDQFLYIPIAGPWIDLAARDDCSGACDTDDAYRLLLISIGVAHVVGTALVISSFLIPERRARPPVVSTLVLPTKMGKNGAGLVLMKRF